MLKKLLPLCFASMSLNTAFADPLMISGVMDGPLPGGFPKFVELYAQTDIADLSEYSLGVANNGGGSDGKEFTFPADSVNAGEYITVSRDTAGFTSFFGEAPDYVTTRVDGNGDDAVELFKGDDVIDVFGQNDVRGGSWSYLDGWAYRKAGTGPDGSTFVEASWTFSGPNALDGESTNNTATTPFPAGTMGGDNGSGGNTGGEDTTAPTLNSATIDGTSLVLSFSENLTGNADTADFTVNVNNAPVTISSVTGPTDTTVTLTLDTAVTTGQTVTVSYNSLNASLQDASANLLASFSDEVVAQLRPIVRGLPVEINVTEDSATAIVLSQVTVSDSDSAQITLTINVNSGLLNVNTGNGQHEEIMVAGSNSATITLVGSTNNINHFLDDATRITYITALNDTADVTLSVSGTDEVNSGNTLVTILKVLAVNDAPEINGSPLTNVDQDTLYTFEPQAKDVDVNTRLIFSINNKPGWAIFDNETGRLSGTPQNEHVGVNRNIMISVSDGEFTATLPDFAITVNNVNDAPTINGVPATRIDEDTQYRFVPIANDVDVNTTLSYSITNKPKWADFSVQTGLLSGMPLNSDVGVYQNIAISVSDGELSATLPSFSITVFDVNDPPTISGTPQTTINEDSLYNFTPTAGDEDAIDTLSFSIENAPKWSSFDSVTGNLSGTPGNQDIGIYSGIVISVTDGVSVVSLPAFDISVVGINDAPQIVEGTNISVTMSEDAKPKAFNLLLNVSDVDSDNLTWSIIQQAVSGEANVSGNTSASVNYAPQSNFNGVDSFVVQVSDGELSDIIEVQVIVESVNDLPTITGNPLTRVEQGLDYAFTPVTTDIESSSLEFSINVELPDWLLFDTGTGSLLGSPTQNDIGTIEGIVISVQDTDGGEASLAAFNIEVIDVNELPVISGQPDLTVAQNDTYLFTPIASDPDGDSLSFAVENAPDWLNLDVETGVLTGTPTNADVGLHSNILLSVTDGAEIVTLEAFSITVLNVNDAPIISGSPATSIRVNSTYEFTPEANDPDGDQLTFSVENLPDWAEFNTQTGALFGTPSTLSIHSGIVISVSDGQVSTSLPAFSVEVTLVNSAPQISGEPLTTITQGNRYSFVPNASDEDGDSLIFLIDNLPAWASFDANSGAVTGTPQAEDIGITTDITISVSDGTEIVSLAPFSIEVLGVNSAPVISGSPQVSVFQNDEYRFTPIASDSDSSELRFSIENKPNWAAFNGNTGTLRGTPTADDVGVYANIIISVSDGNLLVPLDAFNIEVVARNSAPVITGRPRSAIVQGSFYEFTPVVNDKDDDALTFSVSGRPTWMSFDEGTGALTGTPGVQDVGTTGPIIISVSDGSETVSLPDFTIEVTSSNSAPVANDIAINVNEDESVMIVANANDVDDDLLTLLVLSIPQNGSISQTDSGWVYSPNRDYVGSDSFTWRANDGTNDSGVASVNITVNNVNDSPKAVDDSVTLAQTPQGIYALDVLGNDSDADIATANDSLTLQAVRADMGEASILPNNQIQFTPGGVFNGIVTLSYSIADAEGVTATANVQLTITPSDAVEAPVISLPEDININATGLLTDVNIGSATATDVDGNILPVTLFRENNNFPPGRNEVYWEAVNRFGIKSIDVQRVDVNPIVSLTQNHVVAEGQDAVLRVSLNGESPIYPLSVNYTVSGTATGNGVDHDAENGTLVFEAGTEQTLTFKTFSDGLVEEDETLIVTLDPASNVGVANSATVVISDGNLAPEVGLTVVQNNETRTRIARDLGTVTIYGNVTDPNSQDRVLTEWSSNAELVNTSIEEHQFSFEPSALTAGAYRVSLYASDNGDPQLDVSKDVVIQIVDSFNPLSDTLDSDGDLIPDAQEGYSDSNNNGVPDYLDPIRGSDCSVIPSSSLSVTENEQSKLASQVPTGQCLSVGAIAGQNETRDIRTIANRNTQGTTNGEGKRFIANNLLEDTETRNIGGVYDFVVDNLASVGGITQIVIPLSEPIPEFAVYRKYQSNLQRWVDFTEDENNRLLTAASEPGLCPPPGDSRWQPGLSSGHWCVQLQIQDGGPNDSDGIANGTVVDPGGISVLASENNVPVAVDDTVSMRWNTTIELDVLVNDTDADDDPLKLTSSMASFGSVSINDDAKLVYTPNENFVGIDSLFYTISDGNGGSNTAMVTVTISANSAPGAMDDVVAMTNLSQIEIDVLANDVDIDGDAITLVSARADNGIVSITTNKTLVYEPELGFAGVDTVIYTVSDSYGSESTAKVLVTVSFNSAPIAVSDNVSTSYETGVLIDVLSNDTDADGDTLVVEQATALFGSVSITDDNQLNYIPDFGFSGTDTISYTISDGISSAEATVTVAVNESSITTDVPAEQIGVTARSGGAISIFAIMLMILTMWRRQHRYVR